MVEFLHETGFTKLRMFLSIIFEEIIASFWMLGIAAASFPRSLRLELGQLCIHGYVSWDLSWFSSVIPDKSQDSLIFK
jgi:hypothetical protein